MGRLWLDYTQKVPTHQTQGNESLLGILSKKGAYYLQAALKNKKSGKGGHIFVTSP